MRTLAGGLLLTAVMLTGFNANQPLHLGRSALAADSVAPQVSIDREAPTLAVKVTNRTGKQALLAGWLGPQMATALVPARSAIVELNWEPVEGESAVLLLRLYPDSGASPRISDTTEPGQSEDHLVVLTSRGKYTTPPTTAPPTGSPTPSPSPSLPVTGTNAWPYVQLGSGLLGFGVVIFGLAWALGRWRPGSSRQR